MTPEHQQLIGAIEQLPDILERSVSGLNDQQLDTPYRDGGWTPRQVVHHVADSHMNAFIRMKLMLTEDNPPLKPYNQDVWAVQADVKGVPLESSLSIIRGLHKRWVILLKSVPEGGWTRTAFHPERGQVTLEGMLKIYGGHGAKHAEQINGLRRAKGW
jgi:hypothetical protein